jgi:hypothetical protein
VRGCGQRLEQFGSGLHRRGVGLLSLRDGLPADSAELRIRGQRTTALRATDHRRGRRRRPAAVGTEVRAPHERSAARTPGGRCRPPDGDSGCKQRVELLQALVERDQLVAALDQQVLAELVAAEHLEHEAAEVAQALFADAKQRTALLPELARMRESAARRAGRPRVCDHPLILAAEACKQRRPRHANQGNSEV